MFKEKCILGFHNIRSLCIVVLLLLPFPISAHSGETHIQEMAAVLGLEANQTRVHEWLRFITFDMIDDQKFAMHLKDTYGISIGLHRNLFHWGYDARPWNMNIQNKIISYCEDRDLNAETYIHIYQTELVREQKRRNKEMTDRARKLFGFASGGVDKKYTHFFTAMAYDVHLIGDYMTENTELRGLQPLSELVGLIIIELRKVDEVLSKPIQQELKNIMNSRYYRKRVGNKLKEVDQVRADKIMAVLQKYVPELLCNTRGGYLVRRLKSNGVSLKSD